MRASGIRIGTPAITTRGFGEADMETLAAWIDRVLRAPEDADVASEVGKAVRALCARHPIYPDYFA